MGCKFFEFASKLGTPTDPLTQMQLDDFIRMCGRDTAKEFLAHATDSQLEAINLEFVANNPDYYRSDHNRSQLIDFLGMKYLGRTADADEDEDEIVASLLAEGHYSAEELTRAWRDLKKQGEADLPPGTVRDLDQDEQAALCIAAAAVRDAASLEKVLTEYVRLSLGDESLTWQDAIRNKAYANVLFDAVFFCWSAKRADYRPGDGAKEYMLDYLGGRFPNFPLLDAAWEECKRETNGVGYISEEQAIVERVEEVEDDELARINDRYTILR